MDRGRFEEIWDSLKPLPHAPTTHPVAVGKEELFELVSIVDEIKPQRILEIGILCGGSLKFWEQILPKGGLLIGVDHHAHKRAWDFNASDRDIRIIIKDSLNVDGDVRNILGNNEFDFLFIDGDHDIRHVTSDFEKYGAMVKKGGIIAFDDVYNIEGGAVRALFPSISHANEWIIPNLDGADSGIDYKPYSEAASKYEPLHGKIMLIHRGGAGVGVWWKE